MWLTTSKRTQDSELPSLLAYVFSLSENAITHIALSSGEIIHLKI